MGVLDGEKCATKKYKNWNNKSEEWSFFSFLKIYNILIFNYLDHYGKFDDCIKYWQKYALNSIKA